MFAGFVKSFFGYASFGTNLKEVTKQHSKKDSNP